MKKKIILSLVLLFGVLGIHAQEWRAIIEVHAGIQPGRSNIDFSNTSIQKVWNPLSFGLNYSMGAMVIPQLFAGVGIGGYTSMLSYREHGYTENPFPSLYFPIFINARWIPNMSKKINPYVDLKIGYQMGTDLEGSDLYIYNYDYDGSDYGEYKAKHQNGVFFQPGVGVRFGRDSAFNLGIAYNFSMRREFIKADSSMPNFPVMERISKNYGNFMLTFGTDF